MTIPPEIVLALLAAVGTAIGTLFAAWQKTESALNAMRNDRAADAKSAADLMTETRIANVGALSTITMREFERDHYKERAERCERLQERPVQRPPS